MNKDLYNIEFFFLNVSIVLNKFVVQYPVSIAVLSKFGQSRSNNFLVPTSELLIMQSLCKILQGDKKRCQSFGGQFIWGSRFWESNVFSGHFLGCGEGGNGRFPGIQFFMLWLP